MLKGVNRQVVDVTEPESAYFERVIFFVKPEYCGLGDSALRHKADTLLRESDTSVTVRSKRSRRRKILGILKLAAAALSGAVASTLALILTGS